MLIPREYAEFFRRTIARSREFGFSVGTPFGVELYVDGVVSNVSGRESIEQFCLEQRALGDGCVRLGIAERSLTFDQIELRTGAFGEGAARQIE